MPLANVGVGDGTNGAAAVVVGGRDILVVKKMALSELDGTGSMAATSAHRGRRARAEYCMAAGAGAGAGAFDTENNETAN